MKNRTNRSVLDQAAAISLKAGRPEAVGQVNAVLERSITEMSDIDRLVPNMDEARRQINEYMAGQAEELQKILVGPPSNPDQPQ